MTGDDRRGADVLLLRPSHPDAIDLPDGGVRVFCDAYPDGEGIPDSIRDGSVDHRLPYRADQGIQFEAVTPAQDWGWNGRVRVGATGPY